jgi:hypothetical protein
MATLLAASTTATGHARIAWVLAGASGVSVLLLFPYLLVLLPKIRSSRLPVWAVAAIQAIQGTLFCFVLAWVGLRLGSPLGLDAPLLRAWLYRQTLTAATAIPLAAGAGLGAGALVALLDRLVFLRMQPQAIRDVGKNVARWRGFLASFYGGIVEEVLTRLFLMSLLAWLLAAAGLRGPTVFVAAAVLSAVLFAAGHLPAAAQMAKLDRAVIARVLTLNTLVGIPFGLLFWQFGLEHAMVAHFSADIVLHVLVPKAP